jgi:hypothetical protein
MISVTPAMLHDARHRDLVMKPEAAGSKQAREERANGRGHRSLIQRGWPDVLIAITLQQVEC